jgi:hypothetical protein
MQGGVPVFGAVTTGYCWVFLSVADGTFVESRAFNTHTELDLIILCGMAKGWLDSNARLIVFR